MPCTDLYEPPPGQVEQQQAGELHIRAQAEVARHRGQAPGHLAPVVASPRLQTTLLNFLNVDKFYHHMTEDY